MPGIRCEVYGFNGQCVERYLESANIPCSSVRSWEQRRRLRLRTGTFAMVKTSINREILQRPQPMCSRMSCMLRFNLLQPVTSLAREFSRWARASDNNLFKLFRYTNRRLT